MDESIVKNGPIIITENGDIELTGSRRGPKKKEGVRHRIKVTLTFWEGEDDDLIDLLVPNRGRRVAIIYAALRGSTAHFDDVGKDEEFEDMFEDLVL